jgi:hypothetical protein
MRVIQGSGVRRVVAGLVVFGVLFLSASAALAYLCPRVKFVSPGDQCLQIGWTMGIDERDIIDVYGVEFGGYRVWVKRLWNDDEFFLAREYVWGEEDPSAAGYWDLDPFYEDSIRVYTDSLAQNAFPYMLSVTAFEAGVNSVNDSCLVDNSEFAGIVYPRDGKQDILSRIQAIPNPYRSSADWEHGGERRIAFVRLPGTATIRIYTASAKLVETLNHEDPESDQESWDLKNSDGEDVAPGVYIWSVEAPGLGSITGKIMVIK